MDQMDGSESRVLSPPCPPPSLRKSAHAADRSPPLPVSLSSPLSPAADTALSSASSPSTSVLSPRNTLDIQDDSAW